MTFKLPKLPFAMNALEPFVSAETLEFHHGRHHKTYIEKLNKLKAESAFSEASIEDIIRKSDGGLFNNAAQAWNHTFFWNCLSDSSSRDFASSNLGEALHRDFGGIENFEKEFTDKAVEIFGAGWAWLAQDTKGKLQILSTSNADLPQKHSLMPVLTLDVWEHAYYIDYRNERKKYANAFWKRVNWNYVSECFDEATVDLNDQLKNG